MPSVKKWGHYSTYVRPEDIDPELMPGVLGSLDDYIDGQYRSVIGRGGKHSLFSKDSLLSFFSLFFDRL